MLSPHNYYNICILQNIVFSIYYNAFLFNICMSIHPMTKVTGVLDILYNCNIDIQTEEIIADFMSLYGRDIIYLADDILNNVMEKKWNA